MTNNTGTPEGYIKKETMWLIILAAVGFGFMAGIIFSVYKSPTSQQPAPAQNQQAAQPAPSQNTAIILALEKEVLTNPDNIEAWTQLGNHYFDTGNFAKAINAYNKSLALNPNNANVLTDLGVMYRRNGNPVEAVASFDKAIAVDPNHQTARFNKGIVQLNDLNDRAGAIKTWQELVAIKPDATAPNGQLISEIILEIQKN